MKTDLPNAKYGKIHMRNLCVKESGAYPCITDS